MWSFGVCALIWNSSLSLYPSFRSKSRIIVTITCNSEICYKMFEGELFFLHFDAISQYAVHLIFIQKSQGRRNITIHVLLTPHNAQYIENKIKKAYNQGIDLDRSCVLCKVIQTIYTAFDICIEKKFLYVNTLPYWGPKTPKKFQFAGLFSIKLFNVEL